MNLAISTEQNAPSGANLHLKRTGLHSKLVLNWDGVKYILREVDGIWKLQSRRKGARLFHSFGKGSSKWAEAQFRGFMKNDAGDKLSKKDGSKSTLHDLIAAYDSMPKRAGADAVKTNISRLKAVIQTVFGRAPEDVLVAEFNSKTWEKYQAIRQGGKLDLNTRAPGNIAINAVVRQAASMFIARLRPSYAERGIHVAPDVSVIQWLPVPYVPPAKADDTGLLEAWAKLREVDIAMWFAIGLGRFAGLRLEEMSRAHSGWMVRKKGVPYIQLRDRPEEGFWNKGGKVYDAMILNEGLAQAIEALPEGSLIVMPSMDRRNDWLLRAPQKWMRQWCPDAKKPFHRLRGLYVDQYREEQEDAIAARQEALQGASRALGHTTTRTTEKHYATPDALK